MLERAPSCLESGTRKILNRLPSTQCVRTRRKLHSSFWHHGASDLPLPIWWACGTTRQDFGSGGDGSAGSVNGSASSRVRSPEAPFLDFLYPEQTLAYMGRWSAHGFDSSEARKKHGSGSNVRRFHTAQWQVAVDEVLEEPQRQKMRDKIGNASSHTKTIKALEQILHETPKGKQEDAMQLFASLPSSDRSAEMKANLLAYLGRTDMSRFAGQSLEVFDSMDVVDRRASSYRTAVAACVAQGLLKRALELQEEAATQFESINVGTDIVLRRTIQEHRWDLSLGAFRSFVQQADRRGLIASLWTFRQHQSWITTIWGLTGELSNLQEHLKSFLFYSQKCRQDIESSEADKRAHALYTQCLAAQAVRQIVSAPRVDEAHVWDFLKDLFDQLHALALPTSELYEYSISILLNTPRYTAYTNHRKIFLELYKRYRQEYLDGAAEKPSQNIMAELISQHGENNSRGVDNMVDDMKSFYPDASLPLETLSYLIVFYANHGKVARVNEVFEQLRTKYPRSVDLYTVNSLVYVYARRIDVAGAVAQFKRITTEFHLTPDTACWNTLLLAFARADDLDGALQCFNDCMTSGAKPDIYTIGPMLDLCASRGDIEAFEALFSRAKSLDIPVDFDGRARASYVQVFLGAGEPDGAEAIALNMLQSWRAGSLQTEALTHTWNLLITHYSTAGDIANSRRLHKKMVEHRIPLDTWTYAALMRALIEAGLTNAAYKILRVTMPNNNIRVHAFHYALCINGFLREGQSDQAKKVHRRLQARQVPQTEASRQASILSIGVTELKKLKAEKVKDKRARLEAVEEELRQSILSDFGGEIAHDQPGHNRFIDSREFSHIPKGYFALVIMLYTARGAYEICKQLFEAATAQRSPEEAYEGPIVLLTAIMEAHFKTGEHDEVHRCWLLARAEADRLVKTYQQVMHPDPPKPVPASPSLTDPSVKELFDSSRIAGNRRQILFRTSRIYLRSLLAQRDNPKALDTVQRTIHDLLTNGFVLDNLTWNEFIQHLAQRDRVLDAFTACEMYLMPQFPGWRELHPAYVRSNRKGYAWMELRHSDLDRRSVLPRYKTMVVLAAAWARVKRDEGNGVGFDGRMGVWVREALERAAPKTVGAVESMPRTGDGMQMKYLQ